MSNSLKKALRKSQGNEDRPERDRSLKATRIDDLHDAEAEVERLREEWSSLEADYRNNLRKALVSAVRVAAWLQARPTEFAKFTKVSKAKKRANDITVLHDAALRSVLYRIITRKKKTKLKQRVSKFCRAIVPLWKEGVPLDKLDDEIRNRGGIEKLARLHSKNTKRRSPDEPDHHDDDDRKGLKAEENLPKVEDDSDMDDSSEPAQKSQGKEPTISSGEKPKTVEFEVTEKQFAQLMSFDKEMIGLKGVLKFKRIAPNKASKRFQVLSVRSKESI